jgi:hypothetical protein
VILVPYKKRSFNLTRPFRCARPASLILVLYRLRRIGIINALFLGGVVASGPGREGEGGKWGFQGSPAT